MVIFEPLKLRKMHNYDTIIIGGGAAGLMAAGKSAELGKRVLVIEKMNRPGRKLSITGKGRCNITNTAPLNEFINQIKPNGRFLRSAFNHFFSNDVVSFFNELNVKTVEERGGRVFPESGKAVEVVKALVNWCIKKGVVIKTDCTAQDLIVENNEIKGVKTNKGTFYTSKVIVTTGGLSYPATGSTGDGYRLAKSVGHSVNKCFPALVALESNFKYKRELAGLELRNVKASVWIDDKKLAEEFGEMSFTEHGISGAIILTLSKLVVNELNKNNNVKVHVDLKPALDDKKLDNRLIRDMDSRGKETIYSILGGLLPKQLIKVCLNQTNIDSNKLGNQISGNERKELRKWLKNLQIPITGHRPWEEAIITSGGVSTSEINQKTMESKLVEGLFFAGEIIDLDAPTGGYNLQIAFSTAWTAAQDF